MSEFQIPFFYGKKNKKENPKKYLENVEFKVNEI